jgi:hypothetical protein
LTDHGLLPAPAPSPDTMENVSAPSGMEPGYRSPDAHSDSTLPGRQEGHSSHVNQGSDQGSGMGQAGAGKGSEPRALEPQNPNEINGLTPPPGPNPEAGAGTIAEAPQKSGIFNLGDD